MWGEFEGKHPCGQQICRTRDTWTALNSNRKLKLRCLSPQKLFGSHESSSVQLWVSYNRQPMKAARFMTRHPITVSPITSVDVKACCGLGPLEPFVFGQTLGSSSMNELLAQAHNPITSDLEMYVYNSGIESYHDGLRAVLALGRSSRHSEPKLPSPPPLHF